MNKITILGLSAIVGVGFLVTTILVGYGVSTYNSAGSLKNSYDMKVKDNSSEFDNMWKTIQQAVQIPEAKKDAFRQIYSEYANARTNKSENQLMTWIKESTPPNPDLSTYDKVLNIIVSKRDGWTFRQKELVAIAEQYNQKLSVFPSNVFLGAFGFQKIDPKVITSARTEAAFQSGQDNDVELFKKNN